MDIGQTWTKEEDNFIKENCANMTDEEISKILNRTIYSIKSRRIGLGKKCHRTKQDEFRWSEEDKDYLKDNYGVKTVSEIAVHLNRSESSIKSMAYNTGLHNEKFSKWLPEELSILINEYKELKPNILTSDILYYLKTKIHNTHSTNSIRAKINYLKKCKCI